MSAMKPEDFIPFAEQLATMSGEIIRQTFRKVPYEVKDDKSPVTKADKEIERALRAHIRTTFPEHGIIGEEYGEHEPGAEYVWTIDPIDGTKSFMIGSPIFGTLIGLCHRGVPILGIIDQPILGERWTGVEGFATNFNYEPTRTRKCASLEEATLCFTAPEYFTGRDLDVLEMLKSKVRYVMYGGDCYLFGLLANGGLDIVLEAGLGPDDLCVHAPILKGAGGAATDWQGNAIRLQTNGRILACGDKALHREILALIRDI